MPSTSVATEGCVVDAVLPATFVSSSDFLLVDMTLSVRDLI